MAIGDLATRCGFVRRQWIALCSAALISACSLFAGCGGGGSSSQSQSGSGGPAPASVSGTAASGAAIPRAEADLKDSAGNVRTTTTDSNGNYAFSTGGLTPPFLIRVQAPSGSLYSVSADGLNSTTINTDLYTDLIVRSWYLLQGLSIDTAFSNPVALPPPSPSNVQIVSGVVTQTILLWLNKAGIDATQFNLISTPFAASGTGFDAVLAQSALNLQTAKLTISDGTTTQTSALVWDTSAHNLSISSTASSARGSSTNFLSTAVPVLAAEQTALDAINSTISNLAAVINSKTSQLADTDLLPFMAGDALNDGFSQSDYAGMLAGTFRTPVGVTITFQLGQINSLDLANGRAELTFHTMETLLPPLVSVRDFDLVFERTGSAWLLSGNKRIANVSVGPGSGISFSSSSANPLAFSANAIAQVGAVTAITVTGGGIWNATPVPVTGIGSISFSGVSHQFSVGFFSTGPVDLPSILPAGTPFTFTVIPSSGPAVNYVVLSPVFTTDSVSITSPVGPVGNLSSIQLDQPLQVTWTLPTTFPVSSVSLRGTATSTGLPFPGQCPIAPQVPPVITATSASIVVPSTCGGLPVTSATLQLIVSGANKEFVTTSLLLD